MIEAIQMTRTQGVKLTDIDIINRVIPVRSKVKVTEILDRMKMTVSGGYPTYIPATEPDGDKVKLYLFLDHLADTYKDYSGFENHAEHYYSNGTPDVDVDGPDLGNGYPSRALDFNSTLNGNITIKDNANLRMSGLTTGFSLSLRVRLNSLANQNGTKRRLYVKHDDGNNGIIVAVDTTGHVEVNVRIGGVTNTWETTNADIAINKWYNMTIIYNVTGPALTIFITEVGQTAGAAKALTAGIPATPFFDGSPDLIIGAKDNGAYGQFNGTFDTQIAHSAALSLTGAFSIACRFRTTADLIGSPSNAYRYLVVKGNDEVETAGQNMNYFIEQDIDNRIRFGFEESDGTRQSIKSVSRLSDGFWHYAVMTFNGTLMKSYIDGVLELTNSNPFTPDTNTGNIFIGGHTGGTHRYIGDIDEVRVWNIVLTQTDVTNLLSDVVQATGLVAEESFGGTGFYGGGKLDGNIQFVMFERDVLYSTAQAQAFGNNNWTKNTNVGSNEVTTVFNTRATTA